MIRLRSKYAVGEVPHAEHPTPQCMREHWLCLNGKWSFCKIDAAGNVSHEGEILVPFSPETLLSGVAEDFLLERGAKLRYSRTVTVDKSLLQGRTLLHFGAVDSECEVFVNGTLVGTHRGGFTAFCFDVGEVLKKGENTIEVIVRDEATRNGFARGKQSDTRGGIWYTPQSGIWQTVWLESMPKKCIKHFDITPNAMEKTVKIAVESDAPKCEITVYDGERELLSRKFVGEVELSYDFELWSPEHPKLYDFVLTNAGGDTVRSYFGVRSFGRVLDEAGKVRLSLNGKPYFFNGVLDQGYWSDGMLTYPSDEAACDELQMLKDMGFNTVRKHIKLYPIRWYYHCDRLGLTVWQDFPNGGGSYKFSHVAALPFLGIHHKDSDYRYFAREDAAARAEFDGMVDEILQQLYNTPSVSVWVPFNEGWGQFDSAKYTAYVVKKDPTRIVDSVSGWHDQGVRNTALKSLHIYYTPLRVPRDPRPVVLSEFGGYSMQTEGHIFDPDREFGYKKFKTEAELVEALRTLYLDKLKPLIKKGLCAAIYTQASDVEEEINGLVTYDRAVQKVPTDVMRAINDDIAAEAQKVR